MRFEKWQALGNDYIVIEHEELPFALTPARIRRICAPHFGIFADGSLLLFRPQNDDGLVADDAIARLEIYNPDGSRAELSGNGAREAILYLHRHGYTQANEFTIQTDAGPIRPTITGPETCRVDMGRATLASKDYPSGGPDGRGVLEADGSTWPFQHVSIGNPQCAIAVDDLATLEALDLPAIGGGVESDPRFPNRTNVSFYTELSPAAEGRHARLRVRIFERGVGETLSSGTGASGAAVAYVVGAGASPVEVALDGGDLLVEVEEDLRVHLTGWARPVFEGRLSDRFIEELHETE